MLYEVEAFFSQYKSCLDMLVKVLCPNTGLKPGTLSTSVISVIELSRC